MLGSDWVGLGGRVAVSISQRGLKFCGVLDVVIAETWNGEAKRSRKLSRLRLRPKTQQPKNNASKILS